MSFFYLNDDHSIRECGMHEWATQFEEMAVNNNRHVAEDEIDGKRISTVWLGLNHNHFGGRPLVFETMVFEGDSGSDIYCDRYSTWDEALDGHNKAVQWVRDGCIEE